MTHDIDEAIKMGDLVVVMQMGGKVAQSAAPAELLAKPASDYVARFVGADRGLKRMSLFRVSDLELETPTTATPGEAAAVVVQRASAEGADFVLLVDDEGRPLGWVGTADLPATGLVDAAAADPMSPLLDRRTTLKDATSLLLDEEVRSGVVVDRAGSVVGLLTLGAVMDWMQDDRSRKAPDDLADALAASEPALDHDGDRQGA